MARAVHSPMRWAIWALPRRLVALLLAVEVLAVTVLIAAATVTDVAVAGEQLLVAAVLAAAGIVHTEASLGVERVRHRVTDAPHIDLTSVWTFAAALLLPAYPAAAVVLLVYLHLHLRAWRPAGILPYRAVYTTATVVLAVLAAGAVLQLAGPVDPFRSPLGLGLVLLALLGYAAVNLLLVLAAIRLSRSGPAAAPTGGPRDGLLLELATLSMGAVVAGAVASFGPAYAVLVLPPLVVLHRTVLVRQLEQEATTDGKTGLLNAAAWRLQAAHVLRGARRDGGTAAVLLLDLDHFKQVNDRHGHLAGDEVLSAVGSALRDEVREQDLVGRFGGEEFVVLLAAADGEDLRTGASTVADRIRRKVDELRPEVASRHGAAVLDDVTVSVGVAVLPRDGIDLDALLEVADSALYAAKEAGRNAVRCGPHPHTLPPAA